MGPGAVIAIAAGGVVALVALRLRPSLRREVDRAIATKDLARLIDFIASKPNTDTQATAFNTATRLMWDRYERELATELIRDMGRRLCKENIAQYWMRQTLEVEPDIARQTLSEDFLREFYNPEHAARCGKFG